jgi:hypothetical protein
MTVFWDVTPYGLVDGYIFLFITRSYYAFVVNLKGKVVPVLN